MTELVRASSLCTARGSTMQRHASGCKAQPCWAPLCLLPSMATWAVLLPSLPCAPQ